MYRKSIIGSLLLLGAVQASLAVAAPDRDATLVVTAANTAVNQALVYDSYGNRVQSIPTQGAGGVGGNSGGVTSDRDHVAIVNFGSASVSVFRIARDGSGLRFETLVPTNANPVSVAFGHDHLYVLSKTGVESHAITGGHVDAAADGSTGLVVGDGSSAQVGVIGNELIVTEKSNGIETVGLDSRGAIRGAARSVAGIPANVNTPLGLVTRGDDAYVSIAHADEISLVRNDTVLATTGSGTQHAPCWLTIAGPFVFSANTPSHSVSRYAVYGQKIVQDAAIVASFTGGPTDIAYGAGVAAVVDADASNSRVSVFGVDEDGNFALRGVASITGKTTNGVTVISPRDAR